MEKKLETYKIMMMRSQSALVVSSTTSGQQGGNTGDLHSTSTDLGLSQQLGLGVGMNCMTPAEGGTLDWLDRLVLTQIQHTLGNSLTRDKSSAKATLDLIDSGAAASSTDICSLSEKFLKLQVELLDTNSTPSSGTASQNTKYSQLEHEILQEMTRLSAATWTRESCEIDLDDYCTMVLELPLLRYVLLSVVVIWHVCLPFCS